MMNPSLVLILFQKSSEIHILAAARAIRTASMRRKVRTGTLWLTNPPREAAGITVKIIGIDNSHSICPVNALPVNAAAVDKSTMARLLPTAMRVGMWTKDVISGMRIKEPPWPTRPPRNPTPPAVVVALQGLKSS